MFGIRFPERVLLPALELLDLRTKRWGPKYFMKPTTRMSLLNDADNHESQHNITVMRHTTKAKITTNVILRHI